MAAAGDEQQSDVLVGPEGDDLEQFGEGQVIWVARRNGSSFRLGRV